MGKYYHEYYQRKEQERILAELAVSEPFILITKSDKVKEAYKRMKKNINSDMRLKDIL